MFRTDKPINRIEDDILDRSAFAKELANAILSYTDTDNFTISLCGKWGCGKTSIIHMVIQEINEESNKMTDAEKPIIVMFNPWNYSDKNQLISQFFKEVSIAINKQPKSVKMQSVGDAIDKYSSVIDYAGYIPGAGKYITILKPVIKGIGKGFIDKAKKLDSIESQKNIVINNLRELNQKLIVIIDDIDRLNNEQIRMIFQLVNSVAGFPNMIYLLSFDKDVVVRALSEEQNCDGEEYLEKIVQVPFNVPEAKLELVHKVLFSELDKIISNIPNDRVDNEHWQAIYRNCISVFVHSIRDVNRIINSYKLKYSLMHKETNWVDLLCITILQICASEIYNWIKDNIDNLNVQTSSAMSHDEKEKTKNEYISIFRNIYSKSPETMLKIVQTLFPHFSWITGGYGYSEEDEKELMYLQRISSPNYSNLYFNLSLEDIKVYRDDVLNSIELEQEELHLYLDRLNKSDCIQEYIQELTCCINKISSDRYELMFNEFVNLQTNLKTKKKKSIFEPSVEYDCRQFIWSLLNKADKDISRELMLNMINNSTKEEFVAILEYVLCIEKSYGRIGDKMNHVYMVVSESGLDEIEEACKNRLNQFKADCTLLDSRGFHYVRIIWTYLNKKEFDEYMVYCLNDEQNIIRYLCQVASSWNGEETGWNFEEEIVSEYLPSKKIYEKIQRLKSTQLFNELTFEQKQIAIAFSMWYEKPDKSNYRDISIKNINGLIPEWEKIN